MSLVTSLLLAICIALAIGSGGLFFKNWLIKKFYPKKHYSYKRISAIVSPEMHATVKTHAQLMGLTITDYILIAINEKLEREAHG